MMLLFFSSKITILFLYYMILIGEQMVLNMWMFLLTKLVSLRTRFWYLLCHPSTSSQVCQDFNQECVPKI